jgi:fatty acid-binding protein DegV
VRGQQKAYSAMEEYFVARTHVGSPVYTAVAHADAPERADHLVRLLQGTDREVDILDSGVVGSIIGTYAGPGAVAVFFVQE